MGLFDKNDKGLFGGLFDFNGDGKTTWDEEYLAFKIFEECTKEEEKDFDNDFDSDLFDDTDISDKYEWRLYCEDGFEFGVDPEDYETEEEYEEALADAQESKSNAGITLNISVECPALDKLDEIKEEDYPNKRRYNAAYTLANEFLVYSNDEYEKKEKACCRFILDNADTILAANYLSHDGGFLYAQAIKDNFSIPCSLPDEDETREMEFSQILCKIAKRDVPLSFEIWSWCLEKFLPYSEYDDFCGNDLCVEVIDDLYSFPDGYKIKLVHYMSDNDNFCKSVMMSSDEPANSIPELIAEAIKEKLFKTANTLFKYGLEKAGKEWKKINTLIEGVILWCKNYEELESMEFFRDNLLPMVKAIQLGMLQDEIAEWEKDIAEYIDCVEDECEQYAFSRKNAWRKTVPNGKEYGLDPLYYDTEQEYLEALNEEKYGWRKWYEDDDTLGLDVNDFETQEEYQKAYDDLLNKKRQRELKQREKERRQLQEQRERERQQERDKRLKEQQLAEQAKKQEYENDKTIYTYCGVLLPFSSRPYSFRTEDDKVKIGDTVVVTIGDDKKEMKGKVVSVGQYSRLGVPYPVEKTKSILRKVDNETE